MKRKEIYDKIIEYGLQEKVKKTFGRNYTQVSTVVLMSLIDEVTTKAVKNAKKPIPKNVIIEAKNNKNDCDKCNKCARLNKLIEILDAKRILLQSEVDIINNV